MKINKLYRFIYKNPNGFGFKTSIEGRRFALLELKNNGALSIQAKNDVQLHLASHHISVYENQDDRYAYLSQYHYTAYFNDQSGNIYQLHVYFNENDQLTTAPILSMKKDLESDYTVQNVPDELVEAFEQVAIDHTLEPIRQVRKAKEKKSVKLEKKYRVLERELYHLSKDLKGNRILYLQKLDETLAILDDLTDYHENEVFIAIMSLFERIKKSLLIPTKAEIVDKDADIKVDETIMPAGAPSPNKSESIGIKHTISDLISKAKIAQNIFSQVPAGYFQQRLNCFLGFDKFVSDILISMDNITSSPQDFQEALILVAKRSALATELLEELILNHQFSLAAKLKKYIGPIQEKLFKEALEKSDAETLDFLLSSSQFPVNTFSMGEGLSPVLYCYLHDEKGSKAKCLAVLIKHRASIMVKAPDGLSVAYHLSKKGGHPLESALVKNFEKTLGRTGFFKQLILEINYFIAANKNEHSLIKEMSDLKERLTHELSMIEVLKAQHALPMMKHNAQAQLQIEPKAGTLRQQSVKKISDNPEIKKREMALTRAITDLVNDLPKLNRNHLMRHINNQIKSMRASINKMRLEQDTEISLNATIFHFDNFIRIAQLKNELINIECSLKSAKIAKSEKKKLQKRYQEISSELKLLSQPYAFLNEEHEKQDPRSVMHQKFQEMRDSSARMQAYFEQMKQIKSSLDQLELDDEETSCLDNQEPQPAQTNLVSNDNNEPAQAVPVAKVDLITPAMNAGDNDNSNQNPVIKRPGLR